MEIEAWRSMKMAETEKSYQWWRSSVEQSLGNKPFTKLITTNLAGLIIEPLYTADHWQPPTITAGDTPIGNRTCGRPWIIGSLFAADSPSLLRDVELGISEGMTGCEIQLSGAADYDCLQLAKLHSIAGFSKLEIALSGLIDAGHASQILAPLTSNRSLLQSISFNFDPMANLIRGIADLSDAKNLALEANAFAATINPSTDSQSQHRIFRISSRDVHESGGSASQELGYVLASLLWLLRTASINTTASTSPYGQITFELSCGPDFLTEIPKIRALRQTLVFLAQNAGFPLPDTNIRIDARMSERHLTCYDPWNNALRAVTTCFAAACAGVGKITLLPADFLFEGHSPVQQRLTRTIQHTLWHEAQVGQVSNPASGSWAFESLTEQLAASAWAEMQRIEKNGGIASEIANGNWHQRITKSRNEIIGKVSTRSAPLTGVSEFPMPREKPLIGTTFNLSGHKIKDKTDDSSGPLEPEIRQQLRLAANFENLRCSVEEELGRPPVYLASFGNTGDFALRAGFAEQAFHVGGFEVKIGQGTLSPEELVKGIMQSGANIVVLCSSDSLYKEKGLDLAGRIRTLPAIRLILAGKPSALDDRCREQFDDFVYLRSDLLAALKGAAEFSRNHPVRKLGL